MQILVTLKVMKKKQFTFEVVVKPEMANKKIKNRAVVRSIVRKDKEKPEVETSVNPLYGQLECEERDYWYKARKISCQ